MPKAFPMQSLLDHSRHRMEAAERLLLMVKRKEDAAKLQLDELGRFRHEYRLRLSNTSQGGMAIQQLRDYHVFLGKLESAIQHQEAEVGRIHARWQAAHEAWLSLRRQVKSYEVLAERHHASETLLQERQEQRQSDEMAERKIAASRLAER